MFLLYIGVYTYIGYKARRSLDIIGRAYPDATYNLQDQHAKAIDIRLDREDALSLVFRSYVATSNTMRKFRVLSDTNQVQQSYAKINVEKTTF
jgi:hypothetical protein